MSLLVAVTWLLIRWPISPIRKDPKVSYGVAAVLAVAVQFAAYDGASVLGLIGAAICVLVLFWQYRRAMRKKLTG